MQLIYYLSLTRMHDFSLLKCISSTRPCIILTKGCCFCLQKPRVCILGGGFGGLYTALRLESLVWADDKKPQVRFHWMQKLDYEPKSIFLIHCIIYFCRFFHGCFYRSLFIIIFNFVNVLLTCCSSSDLCKVRVSSDLDTLYFSVKILWARS